MAKLFTSDTHFQHKGKPPPEGSGGIIRMAKRPFETIEEHDAGLIARWNEVVDKRDEVFHQGDFAMGDQSRIPEIVAQLNGRIHLVLGNHDDRKILAGLTCFASIQERSQTRVDGHTIILDHYAGRTWNKSHRGSYQFYGHSHGAMPPFGRSLDVGVDCWDYRPVTFDQCVARLKECGEHDRFIGHHDAEQAKAALAAFGR